MLNVSGRAVLTPEQRSAQLDIVNSSFSARIKWSTNLQTPFLRRFSPSDAHTASASGQQQVSRPAWIKFVQGAINRSTWPKGGRPTPRFGMPPVSAAIAVTRRWRPVNIRNARTRCIAAYHVMRRCLVPKASAVEELRVSIIHRPSRSLPETGLNLLHMLIAEHVPYTILIAYVHSE